MHKVSRAARGRSRLKADGAPVALPAGSERTVGGALRAAGGARSSSSTTTTTIRPRPTCCRWCPPLRFHPQKQHHHHHPPRRPPFVPAADRAAAAPLPSPTGPCPARRPLHIQRGWMGWRVGGPGFCMCTCLCRGCASREAARARARARALTDAAQHGGVGGPGPDSQVAHVDDRAAWGWWGGWVGRCGGECVCVHGVGCLPACRAGVGAGGRAHPQAPPSHPRNMALTSRCCQWRRRRRRVPPSGAQTLCVGRGGKEGGERQAGGQRGGAAGEGGCAGASVAGKGGGCASLTPCAAVLFSLLWPPRQRAQLRQAQHSGSHAQVAVHLRVWCVCGWVRRQRGARATRPGASASVCRRATPPALGPGAPPPPPPPLGAARPPSFFFAYLLNQGP